MAYTGTPLNVTYQIVVENTGNQPFTISNKALKSGVNFITPVAPLAVLPGEAGLIPVTFTADTSGEYHDTLTFTAPQAGTVSIPLHARVDNHTPVAPAWESLRALQVWPNPTRDVLRVHMPRLFSTPLAWTVSDNTGRVVKQGTLPARTPDATIGLEELPAGCTVSASPARNTR